MYLSVFSLGPLEYLRLISVELGGECVRGLVEGGHVVQVALQLGRKVCANGDEFLHSQKWRVS